jgi:predicted enzyme related to lactoylglutathione lyase
MTNNEEAGKTRPTSGNGKICYIEIPAIDVERSAAFYESLFGWRTRRRGDGHLAFDDAVGQVSGTWVLKRKASAEPGLLIYIMVDSVAKTVEAVVAKGGLIVQQIGGDAPEITARFSDPAGNVIGLYQDRSGASGG